MLTDGYIDLTGSSKRNAVGLVSNIWMRMRANLSELCACAWRREKRATTDHTLLMSCAANCSKQIEFIAIPHKLLPAGRVYCAINAHNPCLAPMSDTRILYVDGYIYGQQQIAISLLFCYLCALFCCNAFFEFLSF